MKLVPGTCFRHALRWGFVVVALLACAPLISAHGHGDADGKAYAVKKKTEPPVIAAAQKKEVPEVQKPGSQKPEPRKQDDVERLIRHYFTTWSNQDIEGYGKCFAEKACIQSVHPQGDIELFTLTPFLASQREAHRRARNRLTEVPESIKVTREAKLARAVVYWKLTSGSREQTGYDHFTLMKSGDQWKIINLVFYESDLLD